jgi:uncharacterized protein (TIGR02246 family)
MNDEQAIRQIEATFVERGNAGDADGVMGCCTDDVMLMPPGAPAVAGADAVREWLAGLYEQFAVNLTTVIEDLVVEGGLAYQSTSFTWTLTPKGGGESVSESGKAVVIYKRGPDGTWRLAIDIWNTDQ